MPKRTEDRSFQKQMMSVTKHRDRTGCDKCGVDCSTECFIGYCGNVLWLCRLCFGEITAKTDSEVKGK